jgi:hypothetical protein
MINIDSRLWWLCNAAYDGTISEEEMRELELLLDADPKAREFYLDFFTINADILWLVSAKQRGMKILNSEISPSPLVDVPDRSPLLGFLGDWANFFNQHSTFSFVLIVVFLSMTILLINHFSAKAPAETAFIAQISATKDCQWSTTIAPPTDLQAGRQLRLEKGIAQITYSNGAIVLIEGPTFFTVDSATCGFLSQGKLAARADSERSRHFAIATPHARFVDLGTEFGVMIDDKGRSAVAVFAGKVSAEAKLPDGRWSAPLALRKGEAVVCEGAKFTPQVASRSDFPTLRPPPPPRDPSYQRWLVASRELQNRQDLVAYYDFQPEANNPKILLNRAPTGESYNGDIQNATWVEGRFPGKSALAFMAADSGVRVNLPGEHKQLTVIAWVNNTRLANKYNGILMSDSWGEPEKLHFQIRDSGQIIMHVCGRWLGQDYYCSTKAIPDDCLSRWCMIAGVIDASDQGSFNLYLNGEFFEKLKSEQISAVQIGSAMIGDWDSGNYEDPDIIRYFSGRIDELMIFQRALTAEEIRQIYLSGKP